MKATRFLQAGVLCAGMAGFHTYGAFLNVGQDFSSPYYADFTSQNLNVTNVWNSTSQTAIFTAVSAINASGNTYTDGLKSPGTLGTDLAPGTAFTGSYSLTATLSDASGSWQVTGGSVTVKGNLISSGNNSDLLLTANLMTGANTVGYGTSGQEAFDFLFKDSATQGSQESKIWSDFFGQMGGQGAIILTTGSYYTGPATINGIFIPSLSAYSGTFAQDFEDVAGQGSANTFVPEPVAYPLAASVMAFLGLALVGRKSAGRNCRLAQVNVEC